MAGTDKILYGASRFPVFGCRGTLLYGRFAANFRASIDVSWDGGQDLDICVFTNKTPGSVGWGHVGLTKGNGYSLSWDSGDNTSGGPEHVLLTYDGEATTFADLTVEVHCNWFRIGDKDDEDKGPGGAGGSATITVTDLRGVSKSATLTPSSSKGRAANSGDPGCKIRFKYDGSVDRISPC